MAIRQASAAAALRQAELASLRAQLQDANASFRQQLEAQLQGSRATCVVPCCAPTGLLTLWWPHVVTRRRSGRGEGAARQRGKRARSRCRA